MSCVCLCVRARHRIIYISNDNEKRRSSSIQYSVCDLGGSVIQNGNEMHGQWSGWEWGLGWEKQNQNPWYEIRKPRISGNWCKMWCAVNDVNSSIAIRKWEKFTMKNNSISRLKSHHRYSFGRHVCMYGMAWHSIAKNKNHQNCELER